MNAHVTYVMEVLTKEVSEFMNHVLQREVSEFSSCEQTEYYNNEGSNFFLLAL